VWLFLFVPAFDLLELSRTQEVCTGIFTMSKVKKPKPQRRQRRVSSRFMSQQELADILAVNVQTVRRRAGTPGWPSPLRIGNKLVLFDRTDVERFLQEAK
jgi:hypothetical protein